MRHVRAVDMGQLRGGGPGVARVTHVRGRSRGRSVPGAEIIRILRPHWPGMSRMGAPIGHWSLILLRRGVVTRVMTWVMTRVGTRVRTRVGTRVGARLNREARTESRHMALLARLTRRRDVEDTLEKDTGSIL